MEQRDKTIGTRRIEKEEQISSAQQRKRRDYEYATPPTTRGAATPAHAFACSLACARREFERTMSTTTARRMAEGRAKVERAHRLRREHVDWVSQRHRSALDASSRRAQEAFEMRRQRYLSRIKEYNERMEQLDSQRRLVDRHRRSLHSYLVSWLRPLGPVCEAPPSLPPPSSPPRAGTGEGTGDERPRARLRARHLSDALSLALGRHARPAPPQGAGLTVPHERCAAARDLADRTPGPVHRALTRALHHGSRYGVGGTAPTIADVEAWPGEKTFRGWVPCKL